MNAFQLFTQQAAATNNLSLKLNLGVTIAKTFIVHFSSNRAFIEPCMRQVMRQVAKFAKNNLDDKLLILGHTDLSDGDQYNQSLSERRARSVYTYLTVGGDREVAVAEWNALRLARPKNELPSIKDSWGIHEYQHILQDLGFYPGNVNGKDDSLTREAVRAFRCKQGLPPGTTVDDTVWDALIRNYLIQDALDLPKSKFFPNCDPEILKWLGCGEKDPVKNVQTAWRPNRRVEIIFVQANQLPCKVPQPDTFELPTKGIVGSNWCLGPGDKNKRCCFVFPAAPSKGAKPKEDQWLRQPAESATITINGSIKREVRNKDGTTELNPDGTHKLEPVPGGQKFVLITPDGEYKQGENPSNGEPIAARTNSQGDFQFTNQRVGVYTLEVPGAVLVRLAEQKDKDIKGNSVCKVLQSDSDRLDVIIVNIPVLREIRLPVAVHLMAALRHDTRTVRPCQPVGTATPTSQATTYTEEDIQKFFNGDKNGNFQGANFVWRQARIQFQLIDIVHEVFDNASRNECQIDNVELGAFLNLCAYPNAINVFFIMSLDDPEKRGEAGWGVSPESAAVQGLKAGGCVVGQMVQMPFGGSTVTNILNEQQTVEILAHELGHFLNLNHVDKPDLTANAKRLMLPGTLDGKNLLLIKDEVDRARASRAATFDCIPLSLRVTGAKQIGGTLSHEFIFVKPVTPVPSPVPVVTVDAVISDELVQPGVGSINMTGGTPGTSDRQKLVSTDTIGFQEIVATYTPISGDLVTAKALIRISIFFLRVEGQGVKPTSPTTFVARRAVDPSAVITIVAQIDTRPFCVPTNLVKWTSGNPVADPLRRTISLATIASTTISAEVAGEIRSVTIAVVEVVLTTNDPPFDTAINPVQIEGVLNSDRKSFSKGNLFGDQINSLFRARADIPGVVGNTLQAKLISRSPTGSVIENVGITLTRMKAGSDRFVSLPILAIPLIPIPSDLKLKEPQDLEVVRAQAGGKIRLEVNAPYPLAEFGISEVTVRGRVIYIYAQAFDGSGVTVTDIRRHIQRAQSVWRQAGIEVKERLARDSVPAPSGLLDLDRNVPFNGKLTEEEKQLVGIKNPHPTRSTVTTDLNIYYVEEIRGPAAGVAYSREGFTGLKDPEQSAIAVEIPSSSTVSRDASDNILAHEIGHQLLINWGGAEHQNQGTPPRDWPSTNVMHPEVSEGTDIDRTQVRNILFSTRLGNNPFIVFEF